MRWLFVTILCLVETGCVQQPSDAPWKPDALARGTRYPLANASGFQVSADTEPAAGDQLLILKPARVFDGVNPKTHEGWVVLVKGNRIQSAGPAGDVKPPAGARVIELPGMT